MTRAFGPAVYRGARLLCHENPPTSKLNETPGTRKAKFLSDNMEFILTHSILINLFIKTGLKRFPYPSPA